LLAIWLLVFTPLGLLMRVVGRDRLGLKSDGAAETYWTKRETQRDVSRYFHQH